MSKVTCDIDGLMAVLERAGNDAANGAEAELKRGALEIQKLAIAYAPVDEHNLENAIKVDLDERDSKGRFKKERHYYVYVDENAPGTGGKPVGEYATIMHEELTPYGSGFYQLGEGSRNKGGAVGGKFLERAFAEKTKHIIQQCRYAISRVFRK